LGVSAGLTRAVGWSLVFARLCAAAVTVVAMVVSPVSATPRAVGLVPSAPPVVTVSLAHSSAPTATLFTGKVKIDNPPDSGYRLLIEFGEGRTVDDDELWLGDDCTTAAGDTDEWDFEHAYRLPGAWVIRATLTLGCGLGDANPQFVGTAPFAATPGASPSNGPARPYATLFPALPFSLAVSESASASTRWSLPLGGLRRSDDGPVRAVPLFPVNARSHGVFFLDADDDDGFLTRYVIHWGDKSRDTVVTFGRDTCDEGQLKQYWPQALLFRKVKHPFKPGRYTSTLTVTTTGCDGKDTQAATYALRHTAA